MQMKQGSKRLKGTQLEQHILRDIYLWAMTLSQLIETGGYKVSVILLTFCAVLSFRSLKKKF